MTKERIGAVFPMEKLAGNSPPFMEPEEFSFAVFPIALTTSSRSSLSTLILIASSYLGRGVLKDLFLYFSQQTVKKNFLLKQIFIFHHTTLNTLLLPTTRRT
jgi:hypothetical protein